ncbi:MAG: hypothetical protein ACOCUS_00250 [Polyangiales bacterium]
MLGSLRWGGAALLAGAALAMGCGGSKTMGPDEEFTPKQVQCTIDGEAQSRMTRDCSTELSYQERRLSAKVELLGQKLGGDSDVQFRPVKSSLTILLEQQRGLCRDWNACALSRAEYVQRSEWLTSQFTTLSQLLDSADPSTMNDDEARQRLVDKVLDWAERARHRQAEARNALDAVEVERDRVTADSERNDIEQRRTGTEEVASGAARVEADAEMTQAGASEEIATNEQRQAGAAQRVASASDEELQAIREAHQNTESFDEQLVERQREVQEQTRRRLQASIEQHQAKVEGLEKLLEAIGKIRQNIGDPEEGETPPVCKKRRLRSQLDALGDSERYTVSSQAERVEDSVDELCGRFAMLRQPNERLRGSINRFFQQIERIEGWMKDLRKQRDHKPDEAREAGKALRILANLRQQTLRGVEELRRPFPCWTDRFTRIAEMEWEGSIARAQMPGLEPQAERVCASVELDEENLEEGVENLESTLDSAESMAGRTLRQTNANIERMQAMIR